MTAWLLAHQAPVQSYLLLAAFATIAFWESFRPLRVCATSTPRRWIDDVALAALGAGLTRVCLPLAGVGFAIFVEQRGWGLLNATPAPGWLSLVVAVPAIDLAQYGLHRLLHGVPVLWRVHKVHHADLDVDCLTAIRHHPLEVLVAGGAELAVIGILGAPPLAVLAASVLNAVTAIFNHGNVALAPSVDRALRRVVVTPGMHRIHHSTQDDECNANFSMVFPWWDRWFGTWCEAPRSGHERMSLGLAEARTPREVALAHSLLMPFRRKRVPLAA